MAQWTTWLSKANTLARGLVSGGLLPLRGLLILEEFLSSSQPCKFYLFFQRISYIYLFGKVTSFHRRSNRVNSSLIDYLLELSYLYLLAYTLVYPTTLLLLHVGPDPLVR